MFCGTTCWAILFVGCGTWPIATNWPLLVETEAPLTVCKTFPLGDNKICCCGGCWTIAAGGAAVIFLFFPFLPVVGESFDEDPGEDDLDEDPLLDGLD